MLDNELLIIYDKDCPFCTDFVMMNGLKDKGYKVTLIDARNSNDDYVKTISATYNLDDGMVVVFSNEVLYGHEAARFIALSYRGGFKSSLYLSLLRWEKVAKVSYPLLVFLRKTFFRLTGRSLIADD